MALYNQQGSGLWTPVITLATPGDLAKTMATQIGEWYLKDGIATLHFSLSTTAFSWVWTTGSGGFQITGSPFTAKTSAGMRWNGSFGQFQGITKASYTQFMPGINSGANFFTVVGNGSAQATGPVVAADVPTAGTVVLGGSVSFPIG